MPSPAATRIAATGCLALLLGSQQAGAQQLQQAAYEQDQADAGASLYSDNCPVIVVKKTRAETQQSFTLMHELGHLLLQRASSIDDEADMHSQQGRERDANSFAGRLLVPDAWLAQVRDDERPAEGSKSSSTSDGKFKVLLSKKAKRFHREDAIWARRKAPPGVQGVYLSLCKPKLGRSRNVGKMRNEDEM